MAPLNVLHIIDAPTWGEDGSTLHWKCVTCFHRFLDNFISNFPFKVTKIQSSLQTVHFLRGRGVVWFGQKHFKITWPPLSACQFFHMPHPPWSSDFIDGLLSKHYAISKYWESISGDPPFPIFWEGPPRKLFFSYDPPPKKNPTSPPLHHRKWTPKLAPNWSVPRGGM